jgi:FixJ family two-component response regulator
MSGAPANNRFLIAVVDDDQSVCRALESLLKSIGFRTATFTSGRDFLCSRQLPEVSCAIVDVCMPNISGIELQRQLIATHRTPIIFITAFGNDRMEKEVAQAGAIRLLKKPFTEEALIDALNVAIGN